MQEDTLGVPDETFSSPVPPQAASIDLIQDVERLRQQFPRTSDLYREVSGLLFFRYGEMPTKTRLYQLVRRGSTAAPAAGLEEFWKDLREKSRDRISNPDLPVALQDAAGELVQTLWQAAQGAAKESLAHYVQQAQADVLRAEQAQRAANEERMRVIELLDLATQKDQESQQRIASLEALVQAAQQRVAGLEADVRGHADEIARHHTALAKVQAEAGEERQRMVTAAETAEAYFHDTERRLLNEVDRERTRSASLARQVETANNAAAAANERRQTETLALHREIGDLRQTAGKLEGSLQVMTVARDTAQRQAEELRVSLGQAREQLALEVREVTEKDALLSEANAALEATAAEISQLRDSVKQLSQRVSELSAAPASDAKG